jgi:hypothetical protein
MSKAPESNAKQDIRPSRVRIALAFAGALGGFCALLFLPAGRLGWVAGWLYLAIFTASTGINYAYIRSRNPELIEHRLRIGKGTKTWDKIWLAVFTPVFLSVYVVAGLDAGRFGWSAMPLWLWPVGLALFLPGAALLSWSMGVNPFFEKTVRIQTERGHRVIDTGPYRFVRHPGYVGFCRHPSCLARGGPSSRPSSRLSLSSCARHWKIGRYAKSYPALSSTPIEFASG